MTEEHTLDLDALRAARREVKKISPSFRWKGKVYNLPVELPFSIIAEASDNGDTNPALVLKGLLGQQWDNFIKTDPSMDDINDLFEFINAQYGIGVGN